MYKCVLLFIIRRGGIASFYLRTYQFACESKDYCLHFASGFTELVNLFVMLASKFCWKSFKVQLNNLSTILSLSFPSHLTFGWRISKLNAQAKQY